MSILYFVYGSNLKSSRMRQRVPSTRRETVAFLEDHLQVLEALPTRPDGRARD
jgi:hypothetical protein